MQNVNGFDKLGDIHHAKYTFCFVNANFARPCTDQFKGFPVVRVEPGLYFGKLKACLPPCFLWKRQKVVVAGANPANLFFSTHRLPSCTKFCTYNFPASSLFLTCLRRTLTVPVSYMNEHSSGWLTIKKPGTVAGLFKMQRSALSHYSVAATACDTTLSDGVSESIEHADAFVPADARIGDALAVCQRTALLQILAARDQMRLDHHADDALIATRNLATDIGAYRNLV